MATGLWLPIRSVSFWERGGMPVTGSSFALSCPMVHEGVIRRSEWEFSEVMDIGMSPAVWKLIFGSLDETKLGTRRFEAVVV